MPRGVQSRWAPTGGLAVSRGTSERYNVDGLAARTRSIGRGEGTRGLVEVARTCVAPLHNSPFHHPFSRTCSQPASSW